MAADFMGGLGLMGPKPHPVLGAITGRPAILLDKLIGSCPPTRT